MGASKNNSPLINGSCRWKIHRGERYEATKKKKTKKKPSTRRISCSRDIRPNLSFFFYLFSSLLHLFLFSLARHDVSYLEDRNGGRASKSRRPILAGRVVTSDLHPKSGWHVERVSVARRRRLYCQSLGRRFRPETKIASYRFTIFRNAYGVRSFAGREKGRGRKKESKS